MIRQVTFGFLISMMSSCNAVVMESWSGKFGLMVPIAFDFLGEVSKNLLLLFASAERAIVPCVL